MGEDEAEWWVAAALGRSSGGCEGRGADGEGLLGGGGGGQQELARDQYGKSQGASEPTDRERSDATGHSSGGGGRSAPRQHSRQGQEVFGSLWPCPTRLAASGCKAGAAASGSGSMNYYGGKKGPKTSRFRGRAPFLLAPYCYYDNLHGLSCDRSRCEKNTTAWIRSFG